MSGGTIKGGNVQIGNDGTAANNFTIYQPAVADGTSRWAVGVAGATTKDIVTVTSSGVSFNGTVSQPNVGGSSSNTAFGGSGVEAALYANTTGTNNTAFGAGALKSNTTGLNNTAVGNAALYSNVSGYANTAVGSAALIVNTSGSLNSVFGVLSLYTNTTGSSNAAYGFGALQNNTTGSNNSAFGNGSLNANTTGNYNIAVGTNAGLNVTTAQNNMYLGNNINSGAPTSAANEIVIAMNFGGSTTGKGTNTALIGGVCYQGNNSSTWSTTSDRRIKENIIDVNNGLDIIAALRPVEFDYIETKKHDVGFIAQEYQTVLPDQVKKHAANSFEKELVGEDEIFGINANLMPYLVKAIQELKAEIDALKGAN
jgi:hypothetical protein